MVEKRYCITLNRLTCDWVPPPDQILAQSLCQMDKERYWRQGTGRKERYWRQEGKVLLSDLGKTKEPNWGKSYMLGQPVPLELFLRQGTLLTLITHLG